MSTITSDRHNGNSGNCWCHTLDWGIRANSALRPQLKGFSTLCARDFSCAVSGFGQVLKSDLRERLFLAADQAPPYTREKISGTQGKVSDTEMRKMLKIRQIFGIKATQRKSILR